MGMKDYKNLLSYKLMQQYADDELVEKVDTIMSAYKKAVESGETKHWSCWETEFDDEQPNKSLKVSLSYNGPEYFMQVDLVTDFNLDLKQYCNRQVNGQYELVKYFEQKEKSFSFNPDVISFIIPHDAKSKTLKAITKKGSVFSGTKEVKAVDFVPSLEDCSENA